MARLSDDLRRMGFVPTGRECPACEQAELWTDGFELVCEETGTVIDGNHNPPTPLEDLEEVEVNNGERVYRYRYSERVKLIGGFTGSYDWGNDGERFKY